MFDEGWLYVLWDVLLVVKWVCVDVGCSYGNDGVIVIDCYEMCFEDLGKVCVVGFGIEDEVGVGC